MNQDILLTLGMIKDTMARIRELSNNLGDAMDALVEQVKDENGVKEA